MTRGRREPTRQRAYAAIVGYAKRYATVLTEFEAGLRDIRTIQGHRIGNISALNSNGQISVTITATLRLSGGESTTRVFSLIEERDVWKVCG